MANLTLFDIDYTWNGKEADEIFAKPIFTDPAITDILRVIPNVKGKQRLALDSTLTKVLKKVTTCARNPSGNLINISERDLETTHVGVDLEQCVIPLEQTMMEQFLNSGNDIFDLTGTYLQTYLEGKVVDALKSDIPRVAFFGDTASGSADYNQLDGIWKNLFALQATNAGMKVADIPASLPVVTDDATAASVIALYKNLYNGQSNVLRAMPANRKRFIVSGEIFDLLWDAYTQLAGKSSGDIYLRRTEGGEGVEKMYFKGIEVIPMREWTAIIDGDLSGTKTYRMILTDNQNLVLGTDRVQDMMEVSLEYHKYQRVNTLDANFRLGTQVLWPELTVYATQAA